VDELRALPRLQEVDVSVTLPLLRRLLRQPHQLQWKQLSLDGIFDDAAAALLPQLPSLTKIHQIAKCARFEWLAELPNLTEASFWLHTNFNVPAASRPASLVAGLRQCANVEILTLGVCADLTAAHLADLLPSLPRLRELYLDRLSIDSLAFLAQPPMTDQLRSVRLSSCRQLPLADLRHVHALRGLEQLHLGCSFSAPLAEESRALLTPPSVVLPQLKVFQYRARSEW
jgi:hypothetical protein